MATSEIVKAARRTMGPVGAKIPSIGISAVTRFDVLRPAMRRLEEAGYGTAWNGEGVGAKDAFVELAVLLAATDRMVFSSSIANMYARPAPTTHGAAASLSDAFSGRFVLGLGPGYPFQAQQVGQDYANPVGRVREYFAKMTEPTPILDVPEVAYARVIAANGPKMLALAAEVADGAIPTLVPVEFTAEARQILGPDKLLVIGLAVVPNDDFAQAKATAKEVIGRIAGFPGSPYAANLSRIGYSEEELSTGADRVLDDVVAYGSSDSIDATVRAHLAAGADHVILQPVVPDFDLAVEQLIGLAPAMSNMR